MRKKKAAACSHRYSFRVILAIATKTKQWQQICVTEDFIVCEHLFVGVIDGIGLFAGLFFHVSVFI